jgi:hypothetical protein
MVLKDAYQRICTFHHWVGEIDPLSMSGQRVEKDFLFLFLLKFLRKEMLGSSYFFPVNTALKDTCQQFRPFFF